MGNREEPKSKKLEVSVMFEPSRVAAACVTQAYERVVPITRRVIEANRRPPWIGREQIKRRRGGVR